MAARSDADLWQRAAAGDHQAFGDLFERHAEAVWNHAYRLTASWSQAEDLTSSTFLLAWRKCAEVRLVRDSALPWLYSVAGNLARTEYRSAVRFGRAQRSLPTLPRPVAAAHRPGGGLMNDMELPPRRTMPDDVRERLRTRVLGDRPARSGLRGLLAAAAVVVLVAGALVLTVPLGREQPGPAASPFDSELDRCWAALVDAGKTAGYPDRSKWRGVLDQSGLGGTHVTAALAGDKPIFCQTTPTQVIVSNPTATPSVRVVPSPVLQLMTEYGALGGVADPARSDLEFTVTYADGTSRTVGAQQAEGLFLVDLGYNILLDPRTYVVAQDAANPDTNVLLAVTVPDGPTPVVVYDRQGQPDPDAAEDLTACLRESNEMDTGWKPGASLLTRTGAAQSTRIEVALARNGDRLGVCASGEQFTELVAFPVPTADLPPVRLPGPRFQYPAVMGLVSPDAAYVEVYFGGFYLRAPVVNSTFVVENAGTVTKVLVWDRNHNPMYEGTFASEG